jgi:ABC-type uncharacterized transport system permease subunit
MFEIAIAIFGIAIIALGKIPAGIITKKGYEVIGNKAKIIGALLILPAPISIIFGIVWGLVAPDKETLTSVACGFEIFILVIILIVISILANKYKTPIPNDVSK